jgi:cell division septum initiation protein DivIVA
VNRVDILYLLDQLEEVITTGSTLPFTNRKVVDEHEILDILDQIRMSIPEELKAARRVSQERDQVLADARAEADRMMRDAEEHAAGRLSEHSLVRTAESRASEIEEQAIRDAQQVRHEAEAYAYRVLERLHDQINQVGQTVERGLREMDLPQKRGEPTGA